MHVKVQRIWKSAQTKNKISQPVERKNTQSLINYGIGNHGTEKVSVAFWLKSDGTINKCLFRISMGIIYEGSSE